MSEQKQIWQMPENPMFADDWAERLNALDRLKPGDTVKLLHHDGQEWIGQVEEQQAEPIPWGSCLYRNPAVRQTTTVVFSAEEVWALDQGLRRAMRGGRQPSWVPDGRSLTPQERALPRPSARPPMWAQQPQKSKRDRRSTRRVK